MITPRITRLTLTDFRSYAHAQFSSDAQRIVLTGPNGIGKTNILEALSLFAPGRGLRAATRAELERHGSSTGWAVAAEFEAGGERRRIGVGTTATARDRRQIRIDSETATTGDLAALVTPLWLTPAQDRLFAEGASERRRFIDRLALALYPDHASHVARYDHALRERMALLEQGRTDPRWLEALEQAAAEQGVAVAAARVDLVGALQAAIDARDIGLFPAASLHLEGETEAALAAGVSALAAEDTLRAALAQARADDARSGRTTRGIHRTDLVAVHRTGNQPAGLCSTGEQKALLTGILLAQARLVTVRTGRAPLLLLDEIAAHLDAERRSGLFGELEALGCQCWMTGTDALAFQPLEDTALFLTVVDGIPQPLDPGRTVPLQHRSRHP